MQCDAIRCPRLLRSYLDLIDYFARFWNNYAREARATNGDGGLGSKDQIVQFRARRARNLSPRAIVRSIEISSRGIIEEEFLYATHYIGIGESIVRDSRGILYLQGHCCDTTDAASLKLEIKKKIMR